MDKRGCRINRAVINYKKFETVICLVQNRINSKMEAVNPVEGRKDDGDKGLFSVHAGFENKETAIFAVEISSFRNICL